MKILSIETSCDETSIALIEKISDFSCRVLAHETISQINIHSEYGGVYPQLARREHEKNLIPILTKVLKDTNALEEKESAVVYNLNELERYAVLKEETQNFLNKFDIEKIRKEISEIVVTIGPGLPPALWVGVSFANALGKVLDKKVYGINHMEGHIISAIFKKTDADSNILELIDLKLPSLSLLISGGHTEIILIEENGKYKKIGETLDDAVGECFDKTGRLLGLPYPGGPKVSLLAKEVRNENKIHSITLPRPMIHSGDLNFSFSGLKTAVLYKVRDFRLENNLSESDLLPETFMKEMCCEIENSITEVLIKKLSKAYEVYSPENIIVGGGVAANEYIKETLLKFKKERDINIFISEKNISTDNALMIGLTRFYHLAKNISQSESEENLKAISGLTF